jgi:hypothetical protein
LKTHHVVPLGCFQGLKQPTVHETMGLRIDNGQRVVCPHLLLLFLPWPSSAAGGPSGAASAAAAAAVGVRIDVQAAAAAKDANDLLMACGPEVLSLYMQAHRRGALC